MFKRIIDIVVSFIAMVLLAPLLLITAAVIKQRMGGPVIFSQERAGKNGSKFIMYKFRTMLNETDASGLPIPDVDRITPLGNFLRSTSIDELPELLNVLKGDMSIVGPRPLLMEYLPLYTDHQARRHEVKPGVTGWAQVNGRNSISWEDKFDMDVWYVDHIGIFLDIKIIFLTIKKVFVRDSINAEDGGLMPRFTGSVNRKDNGT